MKISVTFDVSWLRDSQRFDLDELNINSEQEWLDLTPEEQRERLQTAIDDYVTPPSLILDTLQSTLKPLEIPEYDNKRNCKTDLSSL